MKQMLLSVTFSPVLAGFKPTGPIQALVVAVAQSQKISHYYSYSLTVKPTWLPMNTSRSMNTKSLVVTLLVLKVNGHDYGLYQITTTCLCGLSGCKHNCRTVFRIIHRLIKIDSFVINYHIYFHILRIKILINFEVKQNRI